MRWLATLLVATVACAPAATQSSSELEAPPQPPPSFESTGSGYTFRLSRDDGLAVTTFDANRAAVFQALLGTFEALELPIAGADETRGLVQSETVRAVRRIAGERMSDVFRCGTTITGERADSWRLEIDVTAQVQDAGEGSRLTTRVTALARSIDGTSRNPVPCMTRGRLEEIIAETIAEQVSKAEKG